MTPFPCDLWTDNLPYKPLDITLTNQHIVFAGDLSSGGVMGKMVIHPFLKSAILFTMTAPYYICVSSGYDNCGIVQSHSEARCNGKARLWKVV